jgi:DNA-binding response OmpR family regulator
METSRLQVLVVEDDADMNSLQCELLEIHGLETVPVYDGEQAMEVCGNTRVDAVLLDVMLPRQDGFETCRQLRRRIGVGRPIILVTALEGEDCRRLGEEAGADAYFTKPFDPEEVIQKISQLLRAGNGGG